MSYIDRLSSTLCNSIINYLGNEDLYKYANVYKMNGPNITRLIKYCDDNSIFENEYYKVDGYIKIIDFTNFANIPYLVNNFKLKYFSYDIQQTKDCVIKFIKKDPYNLRYAHIKFLDDKDIIILVVQKYWSIILHISERLTDDDDILDIALKQSKDAILYASERIKSKYSDLLEEINTPKYMYYLDTQLKIKIPHTIYLSNTVLKDLYFLNKELTDSKYVKMRQEHSNECKELDKSINYNKYENDWEYIPFNIDFFSKNSDNVDWKWCCNIYYDLLKNKRNEKIHKKINTTRLDYIIPHKHCVTRNKFVNYLGENEENQIFDFIIIKLTKDTSVHIGYINKVDLININKINIDSIPSSIRVCNLQSSNEYGIGPNSKVIIDIRHNVDELYKTKVIDFAEKYFEQIICFTTEK